MSRSARFVLLLGALTLVHFGCSGSEDFTGLRCSPLDPCPRGYQCSSELRCARPEDLMDAGGSDAAGSDGAVADVSAADTGPGDLGSDAGGPTDEGPADQGGDAGPVDTGGPTPCDQQPQFPMGSWEVRYFELGVGPMGEVVIGDCVDVETIAGQPAQRDWQGDAPTANTPPDFASRWHGTRRFAAGVHRLIVSHDDGLRVFIGGQLVYDGWMMGPTAVTAETPYLEEADYEVVLEHYDSVGFAALSVSSERGCIEPGFVDLGGRYTVHYYASSAGVVDRDHCFGRSSAQEFLSLDFRAGPPAQVLARARTNDYAVVARKPLLFRGETRLDVGHSEQLNVLVDAQSFYTGNNANYQTDAAFRYLTGVHDFEVEWIINDGTIPQMFATTANLCDEASLHAPMGWTVSYYRADNQGPPTNRTSVGLNLDDCLGTEFWPTDDIDFDGPPAFIVGRLAAPDLWGAQYRGRRSLSSNTTYSAKHDDGFQVCTGTQRECLSSIAYSAYTAPTVVDPAAVFVIPVGTYDFLLEYVQDFGGQQLHYNVAFN